MKRVLAFGTFDGLHNGHKYFLLEAKKLGDHLIVGVARDKHVRQLKQKTSRENQDERLRQVTNFSPVDEAQLCDETLGNYEIVSNVRPDFVAIGHDQELLKQSLSAWIQEQNLPIELISVDEYETER